MSLKYAHMMPDDVPTWERWLAAYSLPEDDYAYDVKVGQSITVPEDNPDPFDKMAFQLSKKRIDVVITRNDSIIIAEVKKKAGWTAIGQLLGYPLLFSREYTTEVPITGLLIAESLTLDTQTILDTYGLPYVLLPE
jgi:hypothetical protein